MTSAPQARPSYRCTCGYELRVFGSGRHRIYFEAEALPGDPVMDGACPGCRNGLPGKQGFRPTESQR